MHTSILLSLLFLVLSFSSPLQADYTIDKPIDFTICFTRGQSHNDSQEIRALEHAIKRVKEKQDRDLERREKSISKRAYEYLLSDLKRKEEEREREKRIKNRQNFQKAINDLLVFFCCISVLILFLLRRKIKTLLIRLMKLPHPYTIIACALLALAFVHMPYGYYNFLHIAVCLYSVYLATILWRPQQVSYRALLAIAIAILYNPIWRITLTRDSWPAVNAITIILFLTVLRHPLPPKTPS